MLDIPPEVAENLGYYVYLYVDPRDGRIRYVGKGAGGRATQHMRERKESAKVQWLAELRRLHLKPRIEILARNLASEEEALLVERCVIDAVGIPPLTNAVRGHDVQNGRERLDELIIRERAEEADIRHRVLIFRVQKEFKYDMDEEELYRITRSSWKVGKKSRAEAEYALAVYDGIVRGVFCIDGWEEAAEADYRTAAYNPAKARWRFASRGKAPPQVRARYLHKSVRSRFKRGEQNSFKYVDGSASSL